MKKIGIIALAATGAAVIWALFKSKKEEEMSPIPNEQDAGLTIKLYDSSGKEVPHNSPSVVIPGATYGIVVKVTNTSMQGATSIPATLKMRVAGIQVGLAAQEVTYAFAAGESKTWAYGFVVVLPEGGTGEILAYVWDPAGNPLGSAILSVSGSYLIRYSATVVFA